MDIDLERHATFATKFSCEFDYSPCKICGLNPSHSKSAHDCFRKLVLFNYGKNCNCYVKERVSESLFLEMVSFVDVPINVRRERVALKMVAFWENRRQEKSANLLHQLCRECRLLPPRHRPIIRVAGRPDLSYEARELYFIHKNHRHKYGINIHPTYPLPINECQLVGYSTYCNCKLRSLVTTEVFAELTDTYAERQRKRRLKLDANKEENRRYYLRLRKAEYSKEKNKFHRGRLTDIYIRRLLSVPGIPSVNIPKELIKLKRAQLKIARKLKEMKK